MSGKAWITPLRPSHTIACTLMPRLTISAIPETYPSTVSFLTYFFSSTTPSRLFLNTITPNFRPKYVVSITTLAIGENSSERLGLTLSRHLCIVLVEHPYFSASCS